MRSAGRRRRSASAAVIDGATGLLMPAGDPAALAAALCRLRDDPVLRHRLGNTGTPGGREHLH
ncbi:hypothetical protein E0F15_01325 [Frankia sp. B2]|nr:hypothetical protein E0F15_01325 [Frankia sp. B2]